MRLDAQRVEQIAGITRSRFARVCAAAGDLADLDDVGQDAAVTALETAARVRQSGNPDAYMLVAARREAGLALSRRLSPVYLSEGAAARGTILTRTPIEKMRFQDHATPERALERRDAQRTWGELRATIRRHAIALPAGARRVIDMLVGEEGECLSVEEVAWRTGWTRAAIQAAVRRVSGPVQKDPEAQRLRRVMISTTEDR